MNKKPAITVPYVQPYRYPSPNVPIAAIRRYARRIAERFHPDKIILFGSYAYGTPHNESDVDLLVIMPASNVINQAIRIGEAIDSPFALDLIVRTPKQIEIGLREANWFLREIVEKGKVIYEAPNKAMGPKSRGRLDRRKRARGSKAAAARSGVLPLSASCRKVPQGAVAGKRATGAKNP